MGWLGHDVAPDRVLAQMASGLASTRIAATAGKADQAVGLHVETRSANCHFDAEGDTWAALEGEPRWSSAEFAAIAETHGHAATLKEVYRRHGQALLAHLHGPFSFVLVDHAERKALLAIDRFGIHSMFFAVPRSGGLVFGSTADSVRSHPGVTSTISLQAIYNYLCSYVVRGPNSIYREQRKLLPAQYLLWSEGQVKPEFYWHVPYETEPRDANRADLAEDLMHLLRQAARRCLAGADHATIGAFLSGGLDSSTVAGLLSEIRRDRAMTFTVSFEEERYDELPFARVAARYFGTEHHEYRMTPRDVTDLVQKVAGAYDEPFGNSSALPAFCCARLAREKGVDLMLAGDGGDEIFAGNKRYAEQLRLDRYGRLPRSLRSLVIEPLVFGRSPIAEFSLVRRARNHIRVARMQLPDRLVAYEQFVPEAMYEIFHPDVLAEICPDEPLEDLRRIYAQAPSNNTLQRMLYLDLRIALADNDLKKVTRMCELADLSVQFPMLDEDLVAFAARVPPDWHIQRNQLRHFYKESLKDFLPQAVLTKTKHGFGMPYDQWLQDDSVLHEYVGDCLQNSHRLHYFKPEFIDRLVNHRGENRPLQWNGLMWDVMMLTLWLEAHDSPPSVI